LTDKVTRTVQDRIDQRVDEAVGKTLDKTEESIKCVATDSKECLRKAKTQGKKVDITDGEDKSALEKSR
jgi:hypothetical protein